MGLIFTVPMRLEYGSQIPVFIYAAKNMGFPAEDCIVIDDGLVGVEAGYRAGMKTLFYNRFNEVCEFEPVVSFCTMKELPQLINT